MRTGAMIYHPVKNTRTENLARPNKYVAIYKSCGYGIVILIQGRVSHAKKDDYNFCDNNANITEIYLGGTRVNYSPR